MGSTAALSRPASSARHALPHLESGEQLTRVEFERRYEAMPEHIRAELIEGVVYVSSPVRLDQHGEPFQNLNYWVSSYKMSTYGTQGGADSTLRLDMDNEPQPGVLLRIRPEVGGQSQTEDGYVAGAPEFVAEVAASSRSIDLRDKLNAYRRNGVREYLVWRVLDDVIDWFILREGRYLPLAPDPDGILKSEVFPGLWLDAASLLRGDLAAVLNVLQQGIASPEREQFVARLSDAS